MANLSRNFLLFGLLMLTWPASLVTAQDNETSPRPEWPAEVLAAWTRLPVQDGGRVKPLGTYAGFRLLRMNAKRKVVAPWDDELKLDPTTWMLDCLFYPEVARTYRCFYVRDSDVLTALGLTFEDRKRTDRYSYDELLPARAKLLSEYANHGRTQAKDRERIPAQTVALAENLLEFEHWTEALTFARQSYPVDTSPSLVAIFSGQAEVTYTQILEKGGELNSLLQVSAGLPDQEREALRAFFEELGRLAEASAHTLAIFAPEVSVDQETEWTTPTEIIYDAIQGGQPVEQRIAALQQLESLVGARNEPAAFLSGTRDLEQALVGLADARGEYGKIPLEVRFYRLDPFTKALAFFLLSFLACAISWLGLRHGLLSGVQWGALGIGTILLIGGIVLRCIIRSRPPVSTLYETILFITAVMVLVGMVTEWISRQRIALALNPLMGAAGMFLAMKYELKEAATAGDTMPSLVAVLDTNFWLATHVTTVTMGYAAGLLACFSAHVWLLGKICGLRSGDHGFYKSIARITYGVQCFGLIFAIVGTILGGIWANYSWGRFWGWDPKENGALLIVLWMLILLHGRMGGYLRDFGFQVGSVFGGMVVAFSWWGVNFLGIGLHSYGFTEGVLGMLRSYWMIEIAVLVLAFGWWFAIGRKHLGVAPLVKKADPTTTPVAEHS